MSLYDDLKKKKIISEDENGNVTINRTDEERARIEQRRIANRQVAQNFKGQEVQSIWDRVQNIATDLGNRGMNLMQTGRDYLTQNLNLNNNPVNYIKRNNDGSINKEATMLRKAEQEKQSDIQKANMIANAKLYRQAQKEAEEENIRKSLLYSINKKNFSNLPEENLLEKTKIDLDNIENRFNKDFSNMSKQDRTKEILKQGYMIKDEEKRKELMKELQAKSEIIGAEQNAERVNKTLSEGNFLKRATTATGELAESMGKSAINMTVSPILMAGSLAEGILPTDNRRTSFDDAIDVKKMIDYGDAVKNQNIDNKALKTGKGVSSTVGGMIPSIIANLYAPGSNLGMITQASGVAGEDYIEQLNEDKTNKLQSAFSGALKGAGSYATEKITGGNIIGKGSLDEWATRTIAGTTKTIGNKTARKAAQKIASKIYELGGENFEELLENQIDHLVDTTVNNKGITLKEWLNEQSETIKQTSLTQLFLNLMGIGGNTYNEVQEYNQNAEMKQWINEAQKIIDKENLSIDNLKIDNNNVNEVRKTLKELPVNQNQTQNQPTAPINNQQNQIQQDLAQQVENLSTQENNVTQNRNIEQTLPVQNNYAQNIQNDTQNKSFEDIVFEAMENYEYEEEVESPLKNRNIDTIGKETKTNAYQYDNPKVKPYFQEMAQMIGEDLGYISSPENRSIQKGGGTRLSTTTKAIDILHNEQGYSYNQIAKGLQNIIDDNGQENNAISKKIELIIDDQLRNGYTNALGQGIAPNQEYINIITDNQPTAPINNQQNTQNQPIPPINNTQGETINWNEMERPEGKIALQNSPKINFNNEISKTNAELKGDTNTDEKVAKILKEPIEKAKEKNRTWAILKANLIDKNLVFEELSRKANNRDLQGKADYMLSSEARGQYAIGNERFDGDKRISKSLTDIIDEVGDNVEDFYSYMYHQLNVDRMTLEDRFGGDTGINYERKESIKNKPVFGDNITAQVSKSEIQAIEKTHPEFKEYAQDVYDYLDANKKELVDKGVISKETSNLFKEMYPHYVPIQRVGKNGNSISVPLDTGRTGINNPIKRAKGGSSDILPLFETMADKTLQTYRASARNNFGVELKNTLAKLNQLSQTSNITDIDSIIDNMTDEQQNNELLQEGKNGNNPTFTVFDNGEKVTFDISQDMYEALKPRDRSSILSKTFKLPNKLSSLHRGVLTEYNPIFSITNAIKDSQDVLLNSQHSAKTYAKFPEAYAQIIGKGHWYQEYIQNGGEQNSYFKDGQFDAPKTNLPTKAKNIVTYPLKAISNINNVIEMSPRLAEYIASREKGASIETAMLDASRVTTNFKAGGDVTKFANRNGATFLNASVQGFQQQVRNIQEANAKGLKGYAVLATKYAIAGVPALILNGLIWRDDDDYEKLQDYVKDNYYCIGKLSNGDFIRIPKGRVSATIQKIVSNATDFIKDGKINSDNVGKEFWNDLKEDLKFAIDNVAPNNPIDNNILAPIVQVTQNKTWYGEDLVPSRLKNLPAGEQFDESTDKLSKWLGEKIGYSPYKINYLMNQYSGGVGDVLLPMGTPQAENNVIEDKFTANPVLKNKYPGQFFEKAEELNVLNNSSKASDTDKIRYKYASEKQKEMSELYKQERDIQNSSDTDADKKKKILEVQKKINKIAENSLKDIDKIKVTGNTVKVNDIEYYKATNVKDGTKEWKEINDEEKDKKKNISLNTYATYKEDVAKETIKQRKAGNIKEEGQISDKSKINILLSSKYTDKEKADIYENFIMSKPKNNSLDTFQVIKSSKMNINEYLKYKQQEFVSDKEDDGTLNGKSVSSNEAGSKKNKFINYINSMDITGDQRILLYAMQGYKTTSTQKKQLVNYVQSLDLDSSNKLKLYNKFSGFKAYKNGTVKY